MNTSNKLIGFPPVIGNTARILILGSMPGVESLKQQQYYGHPRNQFWEIIRKLLKAKRSDDYNVKKRMLMDHRIVLWDVIRSCRRNGSLDSNLRDVVINDFKQLIEKYRTLNAVFCNGRTAYSLFKRYHCDINLPVFYLPSTSPAYTLSFDRKIAQWRKILKFI